MSTKVLFVCYGNVGRSQVAQSLFASLSSNASESAGTKVDELIASGRAPGRVLKEVRRGGLPSNPPSSISYVEARGIDISGNLRKQLTLELMDEADRVVVMAERDTWPEFLASSDKVTVWDLPDPGVLTIEAGNEVFDEIGRRVEELVRQIG
jgi:protein-tyrosine-phosphatase